MSLQSKSLEDKVNIYRMLCRLDHLMGSSSDSEAIQFIDSASRHGSIEDLLTILNVQVAFLPNRCTSKTRPLVARSTACIKRRHRKK